MVQFRLKNPTEIRFGTGEIASLKDLVPAGTRVLLLYGGGSIKKNGVYDQVMAALADCTIEAFGGVEVNPVYETILKAAEAARRHKSELVLGVGGGSVIDAAKFLANVIPLSQGDPWDVLMAGHFPANPVPVGAVLTLPATGSESNAVSVMTHRGRKLKYPFANEATRPRFAILDPSTMQSLSRRQLENGAVDAFTHVLEQYMTTPVNTPIQHGFSETIMKVLAEWGPKLVETRSAEACENVMWAANQALNGLIGAGVPQDWSTHYIGHAITALHDVDHARTLTMIMPTLMRYKRKQKTTMLARYARNVWGVTEADDTKAAEAGIARTEDFFRRMGCPVRASEAELTIDEKAILAHLETVGHTALGENKDIRADDVRAILRMSA
jgi:NADP-dependent alcohol dehydrogenase